MEDHSLNELIHAGKLKVVKLLSDKLASFEAAFPNQSSYRAKPGQAKSAYIDHTLLKPAAEAAAYKKLCAEAKAWNTWSVCVPSNRVSLAAAELKASSVKVCTVVGFPFGYASSAAKVQESKTAIEEGADEIDMVLALGYAKEGNWLAVYEDIRSVAKACSSRLLKVILETSELNLEEKICASWVACYAGAGFLKTSTGFASGGASLEDVQILRSIAGEKIGVKASGGIRTAEFADACIAAGADRLGASATQTILGLGEAGQGGY